MSRANPDPDTKRRQLDASDPDVSAWVSANAGAGKTTVLRNRVLRLLLGGIDPGRILCLTFTKAAAAEMSNRVFTELARWVGLDDAALGEAVEAISGERPSAERRSEARRLFARAIETPGGLRVDTIHGFCTRVLQSFAFEANVPVRFGVLEDEEARELMAQAQLAVLSSAVSGETPELAEALSRVGAHVSARDFGPLVDAALGLPMWKTDEAREPDFLTHLRDELSRALAIEPGLTFREIDDDIWSAAQAEITRRACAAWSRGSEKDQERAAELARIATLDTDERLTAYERLLLTEDRGERALRARKNLASAAARKSDPGLGEALQAEAERLSRHLDRRRAVATRERTLALFTLVHAIRARFARLKTERASLDFDDLIAATRRLFVRASSAFVLYKLDAAIEHLLVDEAQDTNSEYWAILRALTAEFTAGSGARAGRLRTIFAVGDEKQSIYGFQGAEPKIFGEMRDLFAKDYRALALEEARELYRTITLNLSFRSTQDVLSAVDAVFELESHFEGLTADGARPPEHFSIRRGEPGSVDLWPVMTKDETAKVNPFLAPLLGALPASAEVKLARRIAAEVKRWIREGCDLGRAVQAGDVLILVRRRGKMFEAVIRALKRAGVPVAGADRLSLSTHIAVEDLIAAGRAALLPQDDLTLACLLKSPLIGLDDEDLQRIAPSRKGSLRHALRNAASGDPRLAQADQRLDMMREAALNKGVFAFFAELLGPRQGRKALAARLGAEAADASDEVMRLALAYERSGGTSLFRFLEALERSGADIKRDLSAARGEVRVMTVHGAKGLEAPIVFLADACAASLKAERLLSLPVEAGRRVTAWVPRLELDCTATSLARRDEAASRAREERRLLYVAMTRARDRLIVAGCPVNGKVPDISWYAMVKKALELKSPPGLVDLTEQGSSEPVKRWRISPGAKVTPFARTAQKLASKPTRPEWLDRRAPEEPLRRPPLRPSSALDAADEGAVDGFAAGRDALLAGRFAHALLEHLPAIAPERRAAAAEILGRDRNTGLSARHRDEIIARTLALMIEPSIAALFAENSLAEVSLSGEIELPGGKKCAVAGRVDRLALTEEGVLIADFKTNLPSAGAALTRALVQLAIYRALARHLYPGRRIRCFLVELDGPRRLEPKAEELEHALGLISP
ncbi:MAG: double-strand break repair helicase AddA [Hyphomicrobiales bacterium]|nr:double-strand break repair helicase AddA [Hyphomicrobiales bacterium]